MDIYELLIGAEIAVFLGVLVVAELVHNAVPRDGLVLVVVAVGLGVVIAMFVEYIEVNADGN